MVVVYLENAKSSNPMNKCPVLVAALAALSFASADAQGESKPSAGETMATDAMTRLVAQVAEPAVPKLTKFDLDFPGGTPGELIASIQKAMHRPLNAVIPVEYMSWRLPPLKMNGVDAPQLFQALEHSTSSSPTRYGFQQAGPASSDDTVWYFFASGPGASPRLSRFYYLAPYLDAGLTVDDITTAVQTGWRMLGDQTPPALSFHKETKLLIAVGDYSGLEVIDQALKALDVMRTRAIDAPKAKPPGDNATREVKTKS